MTNQGASDNEAQGVACKNCARAVANELRSYAALTEIVRAQLFDVNHQTGEAALKTVERLHHIDDGVEAIVHAVDDIGGELERTRAEIRAGFAALVQSFQTARDRTGPSLNERCAALERQLTNVVDRQHATELEIRQHGRAVASLVDQLLATLQLHDLTRQQVELVAHTLAQVDRHNAELHEVLVAADFSKRVPTFAPMMERLYATYMMHLQRASGRPFETPNDPALEPAVPRIELF